MTCKEYREGEKMLRAWAAQTDNNQQNAQQCPRCKVSFQKVKMIENELLFFFLGFYITKWWLSTYDLFKMSL